MIRSYRPFRPVAYGEARPEAVIEDPLTFDAAHPRTFRAEADAESIRQLRPLWARCHCQPAMASVATQEFGLDVIGGSLRLRLYRAARPAPLLVYFHGGAFCLNNADVYDDLYRCVVALEGINLLAVDYRLAPESPYPVGLEDAFAALTWAAGSLLGTGQCVGRLVVGGDSSGGNFAASAALMARDRGGPELAGQVLIYPLVIFRPDLPVASEQRYGRGYFLEYTSQDSPVDFYFSDPAQADSPYASPLAAPSLGGLPPALVVNAECDPLLDQGLWYAARLQDSGVQVEYLLQRGMVHGFINRPYRQTIETVARIGRFVRRVAR
ncbi:MAG: alpha/beta hydrolase [Bifidobacteriaceae bacterium]|jgi:acetyl esterase|nr:alpha/beta hydrolase [Bifidobacteriaceae bacterium]